MVCIQAPGQRVSWVGGGARFAPRATIRGGLVRPQKLCTYFIWRTANSKDMPATESLGIPDALRGKPFKLVSVACFLILSLSLLRSFVLDSEHVRERQREHENIPLCAWCR